MIEVKVGQFVRDHIEKIISLCKEDSIELQNLQDIEKSKEYFGLSGYGFLCEINHIPDNERYWQIEYMIGHQNFRVCSQFGGSQIDGSGLTTSQRHGKKVLEYLKRNNILNDEYKNQEIEFIVGNNRPVNEPTNIINTNANNLENKKSIQTKNIILYGPPGVGKTYNHKKLISLIESGVDQKKIFDAIKNGNLDADEAKFEDVKNDGRFKFVTFHQSYSYEDFIEGFRPNEDGDIKLEDGIFKEIAEDARENLLRSKKRDEIFFKDALNLLLKDKIENEESVKIDLKRSGSYYKIYDYNNRTIFFEKQNGDKTHSLSIKTLQKMYEDGENSIIHGGLAPYYNPLLEVLLTIKSQHSTDVIEQKNYYLLIDEINRGNISKIFGELITLIEDDKRDEIEVTLPYSKEPFKIPSNLYIIATMNSTDKSIALIDIALRRRFTFLNMKPDDSLVHEDAIEMFGELNQYIEKELGKDYLIGHSYFMGDDLDLEFVLEYKIIPLMEEYFYGDDVGLEKIKEILDWQN